MIFNTDFFSVQTLEATQKIKQAFSQSQCCQIENSQCLIYDSMINVRCSALYVAIVTNQLFVMKSYESGFQYLVSGTLCVSVFPGRKQFKCFSVDGQAVFGLMVSKSWKIFSKYS